MKNYTCKVATNWCGEDNSFKFKAEDEMEASDIAYDLAYNNFIDYDGPDGVAEDLYDSSYEELTDDERIDVDDQSENYFSYSIEEFKGTEEEFNKLEEELYE